MPPGFWPLMSHISCETTATGYFTRFRSRKRAQCALTKGWVRDTPSICMSLLTCALGAGGLGSKTMMKGEKKALQMATFTADIPNWPDLKDIHDLWATMKSTSGEL